jgi:ethanolamine utilization protein EutQ
MAKTVHYKRSEMKFENFGGDGPGTGTIARLVGPDLSKTMSAGIATSTAPRSTGPCSMTR